MYEQHLARLIARAAAGDDDAIDQLTPADIDRYLADERERRERAEIIAAARRRRDADAAQAAVGRGHARIAHALRAQRRPA